MPLRDGLKQDRVGRMARHEHAAAAMVRGANGVEHLESVHVRKVVIQHDQLGQELVGRDQCQFAVAGDAGVPAATHKVRLQVLCEDRFVFDDQDLLGF